MPVETYDDKERADECKGEGRDKKLTIQHGDTQDADRRGEGCQWHDAISVVNEVDGVGDEQNPEDRQCHLKRRRVHEERCPCSPRGKNSGDSDLDCEAKTDAHGGAVVTSPHHGKDPRADEYRDHDRKFLQETFRVRGDKCRPTENALNSEKTPADKYRGENTHDTRTAGTVGDSNNLCLAVSRVVQVAGHHVLVADSREQKMSARPREGQNETAGKRNDRVHDSSIVDWNGPIHEEIDMPRWTWGYNTNGFAHHRLEDALDVLHEIGFGGIALTPDVGHLDVCDSNYTSAVPGICDQIQRHGQRVVVETGARFVLDPHRKHFPSLICTTERQRRVAYLERCIDLAAALGAAVCSLWGGHNFDDLEEAHARALLLEGLESVVSYGEQRGVGLALEPEPGMFVETLDQYLSIAEELGEGRLGLALDVGHLMVTGELPLGDQIRRVGRHIASVAVEDMKAGVHEHLPFGEGAIDFDEVFQALDDVEFEGVVGVELSRASPDAVREARAAWDFLQQFD